MFSELVDDVVSITKRKDRQQNIIAYLNQTLRETQSFEQGAFERDLKEDQLIISEVAPAPTIWFRPTRFRAFRTVKATQTGYNDVYPDYKQPGRVQEKYSFSGVPYYYAADDYFVFVNLTQGATLNFAYYTFFRRFQYFAVADRPAVYDRNAETWSYKDNTLDADGQAAARDLVSCWILLDYYDLVLEGTLAKIWKNIGDQRSLSSFALYKSFQKDLRATETWSSLDM